MKEEIQPKYSIGDTVQLLNGTFRRINSITIYIWTHGHRIEYQGKWYTIVFGEHKIVQKITPQVDN